MANRRLRDLNSHFSAAATAAKATSASLKHNTFHPVDVWESMGLDEQMKLDAVAKRKEVKQMMEDINPGLNEFYAKDELPSWLFDKPRQLDIMGV